MMSTFYSDIRWTLTVLTGRMMRVLRTDVRFSKDYRWGTTRFHRFVYALICTFGANIIADGGEFPRC